MSSFFKKLSNRKKERRQKAKTDWKEDALQLQAGPDSTSAPPSPRPSLKPRAEGGSTSEVAKRDPAVPTGPSSSGKERSTTAVSVARLLPSPSPSRDQPMPHDFDLEPHGLFILHPTAEVYVEAEAIEIDIVAVHGLNGTARKTWTHPASGIFWLEDLLPEAVPNSRIMTFGYDSGLAFSRSTAGLENFARDLLNRLRMTRNSYEAKKRPLVFVAHSLGGIVVKKALIIAHEDGDTYGAILRATTGIVFMGTPHRGSDLVKWAVVLADLINTAGLGQGVIRKTLIKNLETESAVLTQIAGQFVPRAKPPLKIMSFVEQQVERPLKSLIVPEYSAILGLPNEMIIPLNASHRSMCRFRGPSDQNYVLVEAVLKELVVQSQDTTPEPLKVIPGDAPELLRRLSIIRTLTGGDVIHRSPYYAGLLDAAYTSTSTSATTSDVGTSSPPPDLGVPFSTPGTPDISPQPRLSPAVVPAGTLFDADRPSSSPPARPPPPERVTLRIEGIQRNLTLYNYDNNLPISPVLQLDGTTLLEDLTERILRAVPDMKFLRGFKFPNQAGTIRETWDDILTVPVEVTAGRPSYDRRAGLKINITQPIAAFFSRVFPNPVDARLHVRQGGQVGDPSSQKLQSPTPMAGVAGVFIEVSRRDRIDDKGEEEFRIMFHRTVRIPETGKAYPLPLGLGTFPLFDVRMFSPALPPGMVDKGGLFLPMYQMEAMWIGFSKPKDGKKFAIRPFLGGVNGISGEPSLGGGMGARLRKQAAGSVRAQDYVVLPEQQWLDGIATSPGLVRQFVATELAAPRRDVLSSGRNEDGWGGSKGKERAPERSPPEIIGASVEWQVTGRDDVGGLQLQVIPAYEPEDMAAGSTRNVVPHKNEALDQNSGEPLAAVVPPPAGVRFYDVLNSPAENGLKVGDVIHLKSLRGRKAERGKMLRDLLDETPNKPEPGNILVLTAERKSFKVFSLRVRVYMNDAEPLAFKFENIDDFPVAFEIIRRKLAAGPGILAIEHAADNGHSGWVPVLSWLCLTEGRQLFRPHYQSRDDELPELVYVPHNINHHRYICRLGGISNDGNEKYEMTLALDRHATIGDLRADPKVSETVERNFPGVSISAFAIRRPSTYDQGDHNRIFPDLVIDQAPGHWGHVLPTSQSVAPYLRLHRRPQRPPHKKGEKMTIQVLKPDGKILLVSCPESGDGLDLKWLVHDRICWPLDRQKFVFRGSIVGDGSVLMEMGIKEDPNVVVELHEPGDVPDVLYIRTLTGKTIRISYDSPSKLISRVKKQIYASEEIPPDAQRLFCMGKMLEDERSLRWYNIERGETIHLNLRLRGGGYQDEHKDGQTQPASGTVPVEFEGRREEIFLFVKPKIFLTVKLELHKRLGVPVSEQTLRLKDDGTVVHDHDRVQFYAGRVLTMTASTPPQPRALGLGAGGSIVQVVKPDTNDSRIWDVHSSRIINVQLLDSRSFRAVTGLPPPETPVTIQTYQSLGLPFYQSWSDEVEMDRGGASGFGDKKVAGVAGIAAQNASAAATAAAAAFPHTADASPGAVTTPRPQPSQLQPSSEDLEWGLLETRAWGRLPPGYRERLAADVAKGKERDPNFRLVLLDVDDTVPEFKSVVGVVDESSE